jgi:uncharacterized RDD family membrane protein YckC
MTTTRTTDLELPEQIDLELQVANVGSRTLAILADLGFCGAVLLVVYALSTVVSDGMSDWMTRFGNWALTILLILLIFFTQWVYFFLFEWRWNGQTPGKRLLHLRVIKVDGAPVSWVDVLLRNLARPIDAFGPMGLIGLLLIFVTPRAQRLGDVMARTLVIHETPIDWSIFDGAESAPLLAAPSIRLSTAQWELLHRFLHRRAELPSEVRARLAASVYAGLKPLALGTDLELSRLEPEAWLAEFARRT